MADLTPRGSVCTRSGLEELLREDAPFGDLTSRSLAIDALQGVMTFAARDPMTIALVEDAARLIEIAGGAVEQHACSGASLAAGSPILTAHGSAGDLFRSWKVAQTLIETWSGVASLTREIVDAASAAVPGTVVACTRKSTPGTRMFAIAAVQAGGAVMHRLGLSETVLVFAEHRAFAAGAPLESAVARLRKAAPEKKLVIEVATLEEALTAAGAGFDVIQAEKFAPEAIANLVTALRQRALRAQVAAAGGIHPGNAADYARSGADILVTSAPYWARPRDVQVRIAPA